MTRRPIAVAACLLTLAGSACALAQAAPSPDARQDLARRFPGVRTYEDGGRTRIIYGKPMTTAASPRLAAERFLSEHGAAFGAGDLDLVEQYDGEVSYGKFHVFMYTQTLGGLPVELSPGRVLALDNRDGTWSVVYAAGLFVGMPDGGLAPLSRTAQDALNFVRGTEFGRLPKWSGAELVVYQAERGGGVEAVRAWKFVGENPDLMRREKYTFFVDAATGALLEARNEVHNIDVFGHVRGWASPGLLPDFGPNQPALLEVNSLQVRVQGGNSAYTDTSGFFNISHGGTSNVTINSDLNVGQWCDINNQAGGGVLAESGTATPGVEATLEYNQTPSEFETAQVNAFIHTGKIHDYIADRSSWNAMDFRCTTNVNVSGSCNAFFDGSSINFYRSGGGCYNAAYSTVVAHEYGHYIVARLGLAQGAFGEGYADTCAEMLYDTGVIAANFYTNGNPIRDNDNTIRTYPCSGGSHFCGQLLGGLWWHARENLGDTYGSGPGLAICQQLHVDWSLITTGGQGGNSAHPGTVIEILTVDDDDGNLDNGTPNFDDFCASFDLHGLECPDIVPLIFTYPGGVPDLISPDGGTTFRVEISANQGFEPQPGTGVLHLDTGSGFVEIPMTQVSDNVYDATFPAVDCQTGVAFFISGEATDGTEGTDPTDAPNEAYGAYSAVDMTIVAQDDFETDQGWSVTTGSSLTSGRWVRLVVVGDGSPAPVSDYDGSGRCWVSGDAFGNFDVDGGPSRLISPVYDIAGLAEPGISFARWFYNQPQDGDRLRIQIREQAGAWIEVDAVSHAPQWTVQSINVRDILPDSDTVQIRFLVSDNPDNSTTYAAIDALLIADFVCDDGCVADFNDDGEVNTLDVLAFLNAYTAGDPDADVNGDGEVNTLDVLFFLNVWNAGC